MAMRQPGPPEVRRSGRRSWIQIPILLLLMKVFYNDAKRSEIGHVRIGIGLRISGRTSLILQTRGSTGAYGPRGVAISAGRPAVFAVFADTRKISGYHVRGWLPQWVWPTCKLCSIQKRGRIQNHPLKTQIDL